MFYSAGTAIAEYWRVDGLTTEGYFSQFCRLSDARPRFPARRFHPVASSSGFWGPYLTVWSHSLSLVCTHGERTSVSLLMKALTPLDQASTFITSSNPLYLAKAPSPNTHTIEGRGTPPFTPQKILIMACKRSSHEQWHRILCWELETWVWGLILPLAMWHRACPSLSEPLE